MPNTEPAYDPPGGEGRKAFAEWLRGSVVFCAPVVVFAGVFLAAGPEIASAPVRAQPAVSFTPVVVTTALVVRRPAPNRPIPRPAVAARAEPARAAAQAETCAPADPASGISIVNREDVPVLDSPGGAPVENAGGWPLRLDPRVDFHVVETKGGWSRIEVKSAQWPPLRAPRAGWIESRYVQRVANSDEKKCLFVRIGDWTGAAPRRRRIMRRLALRILREDRRCARISRGGYIGDGERFFLSCYPTDGGRPYHYWLSTEGSAAKRSFAPSPPVDRREAAARCRSALIRTLAGRARLDTGAPEDVTLVSSRNSFRGGVFRAVYGLSGDENDADGHAYCFEPPGGAAEITLR